MYRIHHLEQSRSHRIVWLAEELGLEYELITYQRDANMRAPEQLRKLHPLGKAPLLEVDGKIISESAMIMQYLIDRSDKLLRPARGTRFYDDYIYWLTFAESGVMPQLFAHMLVGTMAKPPVPAPIRLLTGKIVHQFNQRYFEPERQRLCDYISNHLSQSPYFAGDNFSAADIQMALPVAVLAKGYPVLEAWLEKVRNRPAQKRAETKGAGIVVPR